MSMFSWEDDERFDGPVGRDEFVRSTYVEGGVKHVTEKAGLFDFNSDEFDAQEVWIPKSQILDADADLKVGNVVEIEIPEWLAEDKDLT